MKRAEVKIESINARYSLLAQSACCLSCGGAVNQADVRPGEICVDLGSGRGNDVLRMADAAGPEGFAWGIDVSDGMLEKAVSTAEKFGVTNVSFIKSRLEEIPLESGSADLIISNCTINHAEDKERVWKEIFRVLKVGGRFVVSDIYALEPVPEIYRNDPEAVAECWAGSSTRDEYLETLGTAGFREVEILEESSPYDKGSIKVSSWTIKAHKNID